MNKVIYVFEDGTRETSYSKALELKQEKGNYTVEFEWVEMKEKEENLIHNSHVKSSKPIKSNNRN